MGRSSLIPLTVAGAFMLLLCTFLALRTGTIGDSTDHVLFRDVTKSSKLDFVHANGGTGKKYLVLFTGSFAGTDDGVAHAITTFTFP